MDDVSPIQNIIQGMGIQSSGLRNSDNRETIRETFAWIDFDHPVFYSFRGSKYNDFTSIQFSNYVVLNPVAAGGERAESAFTSIKTIARFDESHPAIMEGRYGQGRLLVWAFSPSAQWTNLPKSPRFVPLLVESLNALHEPSAPNPSFLIGEEIGESLPKTARFESWIASIPGEESNRTIDSQPVKNDSGFFSQPGILLGKNPHDSDWQWAYAVNGEKQESDLTPISIDQFVGALVSPLGEGTLNEKDKPSFNRQQTVQQEKGHGILLLLLLGLIVETLYAAKLARKAVAYASPSRGSSDVE